MLDICHNNWIPAKQFATTGHTAIFMAKQMGFFDHVNTLHITAATDQVDVEQCYDAANHAGTGVGLQAHGVPIAYILVYLQTLAEMQFHLCYGFGHNDEGFKGTVGTILVVWVKAVAEHPPLGRSSVGHQCTHSWCLVPTREQGMELK